MKKIFFLIICILILTGCDDNKNYYRVELDEPYEICGKKVYVSNSSTFENELEMNNLIAEINEICEHDKLEEVKQDIDIILGDDSLTKQDILKELNKIYQYLNK